MSSVVLKLTSLLVKTLSKPIANRIKAQAREHERFRRVCVQFAQGVHRVDMRLRLGLLQDTEAIDKQIAREAAEAQARNHRLEAPTVRNEAEQKAYDQKTADEKRRIKDRLKPRIRPLSESKAIDTGANFVSESFLFLVGFGLIIFETWRRERKETTRREDVADRIGDLEETERSSRRALVELEKEILRLRAKAGEAKPTRGRLLPKELWDVNEQEEQETKKPRGWLSWFPRFSPEQSSETLQGQPGKSSSSEADTMAKTATAPLQAPVNGDAKHSPDSRKDNRTRHEAPAP